jgi:hypothetical protein
MTPQAIPVLLTMSGRQGLQPCLGIEHCGCREPDRRAQCAIRIGVALSDKTRLVTPPKTRWRRRL